MPPTRITIRLSPTLAARLAATVGPHGTLADVVRHALEAYLETDPSSRQPASATAAATADDVIALAATTAATLAAIHVRLETVEERLTALEAVAAAGSQRQTPGLPAAASAADTPSPQLLGTYDLAAAVTRIQTLHRQGLSMRAIAGQLTAEGVPTRRGGVWDQSSVRHLLKTYGEG